MLTDKLNVLFNEAKRIRDRDITNTEANAVINMFGVPCINSGLHGFIRTNETCPDCSMRLCDSADLMFQYPGLTSSGAAEWAIWGILFGIVDNMDGVWADDIILSHNSKTPGTDAVEIFLKHWGV